MKPILFNSFTYQELAIVKKLRVAKFPVYLVSISKRNYALKMFPHSKNGICRNYQHEARFAKLKHPNIINFLDHVDAKEIMVKGQREKISYILMEYAPYGDFFDFVVGHPMDQILARTYFHQLIEGLEYMHNMGCAHLDLKLDNLLLGNDFQLKITDFDLSYFPGDEKTVSRGTIFVRAPELKNQTCKNYQAADIFSAGILLFVFLTGGGLPQKEDQLVDGENLYQLLQHDNEKFWRMHEHLSKQAKHEFVPEFKELFTMMTKENPEERFTIQQVKESAWYNGPTYSKEELKFILKPRFG